MPECVSTKVLGGIAVVVSMLQSWGSFRKWKLLYQYYHASYKLHLLWWFGNWLVEE